MKVSRVTPFLADFGGGKNLLFVKVDTDGGPHGWVECYTQAVVSARNAGGVRRRREGHGQARLRCAEVRSVPWAVAHTIAREAEEQAVATVAAVREAVGEGVDLLIEVHRRLAPMHAIRIARAMERFRPFWFEEPVSSTNLDALAECRRQITLPIVTVRGGRRRPIRGR